LTMSATTKKKHVEREIYEDFSVPSDDLTIVKVVKPRGNNLHQVVNPAGEEFLVSMPPKFRKHLWIKRGDYVVVEDIPEGDKVRGEICRVLMKDHIKIIQESGKWPKEFSDVNDKNQYDKKEIEKNNKIENESVSKNNSDNESESDSDNDDDLIANPNRQILYREETESETETESEEEGSDEEKDD